MSNSQKHLSYITFARMPTEKAHGVSIAHMANSFAKEGEAVTLIIPTRANPISTDLFSYYGVPKNFSVQKVATADFGNALALQPLFFLQRLLYLRALRKIPIPAGIVYTREPEIAWKFSKTHRAVFEAHRWPKGIAGWFMARLVKNAALVVCNSRGTEEAAKGAGILRTVVAPNGFDPSLFEERNNIRAELGLPEGVLALYAGSDREGKGAEIVAEAGKRIQAPVSVVSIGGKEKRVEPQAVPQYLLSADILILPNTRDGESEWYTSPIKLFEYLGAGKAIIASDLPSIREILHDGDALFIPPGDTAALVKAIEALAQDSARREKLAARAKSLSVSYSWDKRASCILNTL